MNRPIGEVPTRVFGPGEVIFREGDDPKGEAFMVCTGRVEIRTQISGEDRLLRVLRHRGVAGRARVVRQRTALGHRGGRRGRHAHGDPGQPTRPPRPPQSLPGGGYHPRPYHQASGGRAPVAQGPVRLIDINLKTAKALGLTIPPSLLLGGESGQRWDIS